MAHSEFFIIERYFSKQRVHREDVILGVGDDCALLGVPEGMELAVSIDTMVAGRHFPEEAPPDAIGHKALAVSLSDLAAMGADPAWATLSLSIPESDEHWLSEFASGLFGLAEHFDVQLVGGDTVKGPLVLTTQLHGFLPRGTGLRRDGARPGDAIFVSGTLGDAGMGLALATGEYPSGNADSHFFLERLHRPEPRIELGQALRGTASAAIDISDGLVADLVHILERSGAGASIDVERLPLSSALQRKVSPDEGWRLALSSGDDYELCFTVPADQVSKLPELPVTVTQIGTMEVEPGLRVRHAGEEYQGPLGGYDHFRSNGDAR